MFARLGLTVVKQNGGDFVDVILLYTNVVSLIRILPSQLLHHYKRHRSILITKMEHGNISWQTFNTWFVFSVIFE